MSACNRVSWYDDNSAPPCCAKNLINYGGATPDWALKATVHQFVTASLDGVSLFYSAIFFNLLNNVFCCDIEAVEVLKYRSPNYTRSDNIECETRVRAHKPIYELLKSPLR
ncbi:unnamed protein product [Parnassius mnemosyne]|uniref:Uncharacterized protein n=1 Tax=Parnassius mnemosyne TaxID=213953 RepID=A0AAV1K9P6_9NEOP